MPSFTNTSRFNLMWLVGGVLLLLDQEKLFFLFAFWIMLKGSLEISNRLELNRLMALLHHRAGLLALGVSVENIHSADMLAKAQPGATIAQELAEVSKARVGD